MAMRLLRLAPFTPKLSLITATYQRPKIFQTQVLPSVQAQKTGSCNWEWLVINDGDDPTIPRLLEAAPHPPFPIRHISLKHPTAGFGLCHARNLGLAAARGEWVAYLDDDNQLAPDYICQVLDFLQHRPQLQCAMVQQRRRRDRAETRGKSFISPQTHCTVADLISQHELFDSNGFIHRRTGAPAWNPNYRIFCDYDYFLSCLIQWGESSFGLCHQVLLDYVQSPNGEIGRSRYGDWAIELHMLLQLREQHSLVEPHRVKLQKQVQQWQRKEDHSIAAFS